MNPLDRTVLGNGYGGNIHIPDTFRKSCVGPATWQASEADLPDQCRLRYEETALVRVTGL